MDPESIPGLINSLPNEALVMIIKKIKLNKRLPLRTLCSRIKELIETIGAGQKSLYITENTSDSIDIDRLLMSGLFTLQHDRFLTHPNFEEGQIVIAPKHLNRNFADLITRVFPNVEQLFYDMYVNLI